MHDTLQRGVSAHAVTGALVIRRLSHADSRQAGSSCMVRLSLAQSARGRATQGFARSLVSRSCSDIAVEGGKGERQRGQTAGFVSLRFWP